MDGGLCHFLPHLGLLFSSSLERPDAIPVVDPLYLPPLFWLSDWSSMNIQCSIFTQRACLFAVPHWPTRMSLLSLQAPLPPLPSAFPGIRGVARPVCILLYLIMQQCVPDQHQEILMLTTTIVAAAHMVLGLHLFSSICFPHAHCFVVVPPLCAPSIPPQLV